MNERPDTLNTSNSMVNNKNRNMIKNAKFTAQQLKSSHASITGKQQRKMRYDTMSYLNITDQQLSVNGLAKSTDQQNLELETSKNDYSNLDKSA